VSRDSVAAAKRTDTAQASSTRCSRIGSAGLAGSVFNVDVLRNAAAGAIQEKSYRGTRNPVERVSSHSALTSAIYHFGALAVRVVPTVMGAAGAGWARRCRNATWGEDGVTDGNDSSAIGPHERVGSAPQL
jgi:hypothetical protein